MEPYCSCTDGVGEIKVSEMSSNFEIQFPIQFAMSCRNTVLSSQRNLIALIANWMNSILSQFFANLL